MKETEESKLTEKELKESFEIAQQLAASLTGEVSEEEVRQLKTWCDVSEAHSQLYNNLRNEQYRQMKKAVFHSFNRESGWASYQQKRVVKQRRFYWQMARYAAILLLPLSIAFFFYVQNFSVSQDLPLTSAPTIYPGGPRAILILADGEKIDLEQQEGLIAPDDKGMIVYNRKNQLSYQDSLQECQTEEIKYNEVVVPKCGEFQLLLSDGTIVYLNSVTKIRYPVRFGKEKREVELEGEAYFKVAKDAQRPFTVKTPLYQVTVLGTQFNISTYGEEEISKTTLVEGEVMVTADRFPTFYLKPNQQFSWNKITGRTKIQTVDVSDDIAWKDAKFRFRDARLEDIMRVIERWYDVEVEYEDQAVKDFRFGFNVGRHETIGPLLRIFELNGKVKISRKGKILKIRRGR